MGGMFYLLGLYWSAITFERLAPDRSGTEAPGRWPRWFWPSIMTLAMGVCAVLTKESHLTFFAAVPLVYLCFFRKRSVRSLSLGTLAGVLAALGTLGWGAAYRYEGALWIALPWAAAALVLGVVSGAPAAENERFGRVRSITRKRIAALWAFVVVVIGLGAVAFIAFPYVYTRTLGALTGYQGSSYVRSLCTQAYAVPWMLLRCIAPVRNHLRSRVQSVAQFEYRS